MIIDDFGWFLWIAHDFSWFFMILVNFWWLLMIFGWFLDGFWWFWWIVDDFWMTFGWFLMMFDDFWMISGWFLMIIDDYWWFWGFGDGWSLKMQQPETHENLSPKPRTGSLWDTWWQNCGTNAMEKKDNSWIHWFIRWIIIKNCHFGVAINTHTLGYSPFILWFYMTYHDVSSMVPPWYTWWTPKEDLWQHLCELRWRGTIRTGDPKICPFRVEEIWYIYIYNIYIYIYVDIGIDIYVNNTYSVYLSI